MLQCFLAMKTPNPLTLSIIILNYNADDWLEKTLLSIEQFPPDVSGEVIVVDNASTDGSVEMVKEKFPRVKLLELKENGGFAKGNNAGIRIAKGKYIMLLNSDTEFTEKTHFADMIEYFKDLPEIGVMTPKLVLADGSIDLASHRGEPTVWASLTYFAKLEQFFPNTKLFTQYHQSWKDFDQTHEIEACSGAAMIVRASALKKVGLLDENFFMYGEDLDWCRRFREAGYKVVYFPHSQIIHHKYKSGRGKMSDVQHASSTEHHFWETMKQYYEKHYAKNRFTKKLIHLGVDAMRKVKGKR